MALKDLNLQLKIIRLSFYAKMAHRNTRNYAVDPTDNYTHYDPISSEKLTQEAIKIGDTLVKSVIRDRDDCNWLSLEYIEGFSTGCRRRKNLVVKSDKWIGF